MTTSTETRPYCPRLIWMRGRERPCGVEMGLIRWTDHTGAERVACRHHRLELQTRYPETLP